MNKGARQFVEDHFADTTIGLIRLLVDATFRRVHVRRLVEKTSQVQHSVEIVSHFVLTKRHTQRNVASIKCHGLFKKRKENHKKSHGLPSSFASPTYTLLRPARGGILWCFKGV